MKKFFTILALLLGVSTFGFSFERIPPETRHMVQTLLSLPEARQLLTQIQKEGPITLQVAPLGPEMSNAAWEGTSRRIFLNSSKYRTEGGKLCSTLFEMHNAVSNKQFIYYDTLACQGRISKQEYVEAIERIEHQNAVKTSALIEKGIRQGLYPADAHWRIPQHFDEHFRIQLRNGHSAYIASAYDDLLR